MPADILSRLQESLGDRYRVERELGRGGMARVYLAHDLRHDRPVMLKVFHPQLGAELGERFLREIERYQVLQLVMRARGSIATSRERAVHCICDSLPARRVIVVTTHAHSAPIL